MDKSEHGKRLRAAMAARQMSNEALADLIGVAKKTVYNWRSGGTMPSDADRATLRRHLGPYDDAGDPVEIAIKSSPLAGFRQTKVIGFYQEQLHEQQREERAG